MNSSALPYWLSLMVLLVALYGGWKWWQVQQFEKNQLATTMPAGAIEYSGPPLEEFELTERSGQQFSSAEMRGKVWVATFFFATCQGSCKRLNASVKYLNGLEELDEVTWVSITVDPATDTLENLREYADQYHADPEQWLFVRGELGYVKRVGEDLFKLPVSWRGHSDRAIVVDKAGKIRGMFDITRRSNIDKICDLLVELLAEEGPETSEVAAASTTPRK